MPLPPPHFHSRDRRDPRVEFTDTCFKCHNGKVAFFNYFVRQRVIQLSRPKKSFHVVIMTPEMARGIIIRASTVSSLFPLSTTVRPFRKTRFFPRSSPVGFAPVFSHPFFSFFLFFLRTPSGPPPLPPQQSSSSSFSFPWLFPAWVDGF